MRTTLILAVAFCLAGCSVEFEAKQQRLNSDVPVLVATAPDGTRLWRVRDHENQETVYFSSTGTERHATISHGKITEHKRLQVPNGDERKE